MISTGGAEELHHHGAEPADNAVLGESSNTEDHTERNRGNHRNRCRQGRGEARQVVGLQARAVNRSVHFSGSSWPFSPITVSTYTANSEKDYRSNVEDADTTLRNGTNSSKAPKKRCGCHY